VPEGGGGERERGRERERWGMAGGGGESESTALEFTPTWIVAGVCSLIVVVSLAAERCLHYLGKVTDSCFLAFLKSKRVARLPPELMLRLDWWCPPRGQTFKGKNQKALFEALLKVKEGIDLFFSSI